MPIVDREDRAAATKAEVARRERKKKKVQVKPPARGASAVSRPHTDSSSTARDLRRPEVRKEIDRATRPKPKPPKLSFEEAKRLPSARRSGLLEGAWGAWEGLNKLLLGEELYTYVEDSTKPANRRRPVDKTWLAAELALLPVPGKGLPSLFTRGGRALFGTKRAAQAVKKGEGLTGALDELDRPLLEPFRKGKVTRTLKEGGLSVEVPAAKGAVPRWVGDQFETYARQPLSRIPGVPVKSRRAKIVREIEKNQRALRKALEEPGSYLKALGNQRSWKTLRKKFSSPEQYALRLVGEGVDPELVVARELKWAQEADSPVQKINHLIQADLFLQASKYVAKDPDGLGLVVAENAPPLLREVWDLAVETSSTREEIYAKLGLLDPETMEGRVQAVGKLLEAPSWTQSTEGQLVAFRELPERQKLEAAVRASVEDPELADDFMRMIDARALTEAQKRRMIMQEEIDDLLARSDLDEAGRTRLETLQAEVAKPFDPSLYYGRLHDVTVGIPDDAAEKLAKSKARARVADTIEKLPPAREISEIADKILKSGVKLPPELSTKKSLTKAITRVYSLAAESGYDRDWYDQAAEMILFVSERTGIPVKETAQIFAIYSQAADTVANASFVATAINQWKHFGKVYAGRFPERQSQEVMNVLNGEPWSGRKRSAFYENMIESVEKLRPGTIDPAELSGKPVTVDRWVVRMFAPELGRDVPAQYYDAMEQLLQDMAARIGWEPKELQAAAWVTSKAQSLEASARKSVRHKAGAADAFQYGVDRYFGEGTLFDAPGTHPDTLRAVNSIRKPDGGFSLHADLTEAQPTRYVAAYGAYEFRLDPKKIKPRDLELYRDAHSDVLRRDKKALIGGWHNSEDGIAYLDISKPFKRRADAIRFAREQGQLSIYDAEAEDVIPTGLTPEEADAIKAQLKQAEPKPSLPQPLAKKEVSVPDPREEFDAFLNDVAAKLEWPRNAESRAILEDNLFDFAQKYPDNPVSKEFLAKYEARYAQPDIDEIFGPATLGDDAAEDVARGTEGAPGLVGEGGLSGAGGAPGAGSVGSGKRVLGLYESSKGTPGRARGGRVSVAEDLDEPISVLGHEMAHFQEDIFLKADRAAFEKATGEVLSTYRGAEVFAEMAEEWQISFALGREADIPDSMKPVMERLGKAALAEYEKVGNLRRMRRELPEEVVDIFDSWIAFQEVRGGGKIRVPYRRGLPANLRSPLRTLKALARFASSARFGGRRKAAIGRGATDPTVKKVFRGWLRRQGNWKGNVTDILADDLFKAVRIDDSYRMRKELLKGATEMPASVDDVPIKVDPELDAPPQLRRLLDMFDDFEIGEKRSLRELEQVDMELTEEFVRHLFPSVVDGQDARSLAMKMLEGELTEPIDNIRWIPREAFDASDILNTPAAIAATQEGWRKLEALGKTTDAFNDLMKAQLLILNLPPYITMNLGGNTAMILFQQGPFALWNLPRAAMASVGLGRRNANWVDHVMGSGFAHQADLRTPVKWALNPLNAAISRLVDLIPRRAAFLYEAGKLGYKTDEDFTALRKAVIEGDAEATSDYLYIWRRANNAIIDYEDLGPVERRVVTRIFFIYPWIKGATKYTARFPADHPWQALAFAYLYERQQSLADAELGEDRPWYSDLEIPIGRVDRFGKEYPYTINPKQLVPMTTPYEYAQTLLGFATGDPLSQPAVETLNPILGNLVTALSGKRAFDQAEVDQGVGTFLQESDPRNAPLIKRIQDLLISEAELEDSAGNKLYPRNKLDLILKAVLGSLAPKPYSPEKGSWLGTGERGRTPEFEMREKLQEFEEAFGMPAPPAVVAAYESKADWKRRLSAAHREKSDLSDEELAELKLELLLERKPEFSRVRSGALEAIRGGDWEAVVSWVEDELGWNDLEAITRAKNEKARAGG